jgi:hypothetical protein
MPGRVGQVWRVLDEDDREAGLVLVVESGPHDQPWPSWGVSAHRVVVLWERAEGWVAWNLDTAEDGRMFLVEGADGEVDTNAELVQL